jgi:hypothetical protein
MILIVVGALLAMVQLLWLYGERWRPLRRSTWRMLRDESKGIPLDVRVLAQGETGR